MKALQPPDDGDSDLTRWRAAERRRLLRLREALGAAVRERRTRGLLARIDDVVGDLVGDVRGRTIAAYAAMRGEPDLHAWWEKLGARGARLALPVVVARDAPLEFRTWRVGDALVADRFGIPIPAAGEAAHPDVVVMPLVGFDRARYRLGYGGGYFDRTLAVLRPAPRTIGVGFACAELASVRPQPHDVELDAIVTEREVLRRP